MDTIKNIGSVTNTAAKLASLVGATLALASCADSDTFVDELSSSSDERTDTAEETIASSSQALITDHWRIFADETGTVYGIDSDYKLRWYKDLSRHGSVATQWAPISGSIIGEGWQNTRHVFSGGQGRIYQVRNNGDLHYYHDRNDGVWGWYAGSGNLIGWGWSNFTHVFSPSHSGTIFAVNSFGQLYQYDDVGRDGTHNWSSGSGCDLTAISPSYRDILRRGRLFAAGPSSRSFYMLDGVDGKLWIFDRVPNATRNQNGQCVIHSDWANLIVSPPGWGNDYSVLTSGGSLGTTQHWNLYARRMSDAALVWHGRTPKTSSPLLQNWSPLSGTVVGTGWSW